MDSAASASSAATIVAVLGDNRPEWLIAELAAQSVGAAVVGIYPTSIGEELHHILSLANVKVVVAEDQEQVDKLIRLRAEAAAGQVGPLRIETVVYYDPHGLEQYTEPWLRDFTAVEAAGRDWAESHAGWLDEHVAAGQAADVARHLHDLGHDEQARSSPSSPTPTCSPWPSTSPRSTPSGRRTATSPSCPSRGSASRCSPSPAGCRRA